MITCQEVANALLPLGYVLDQAYFFLKVKTLSFGELMGHDMLVFFSSYAVL